jgi:hypothetical protein
MENPHPVWAPVSTGADLVQFCAQRIVEVVPGNNFGAAADVVGALHRLTQVAVLRPTVAKLATSITTSDPIGTGVRLARRGDITPKRQALLAASQDQDAPASPVAMVAKSLTNSGYGAWSPMGSPLATAKPARVR